MYEQWSNEIHNKPKLRTYVQIKDTFEPEPYVLSNISHQRRSLLAQIRLGILPIKYKLVELGVFQFIKGHVNCVKYKKWKLKYISYVNIQCTMIFEKRYMSMRNL